MLVACSSRDDNMSALYRQIDHAIADSSALVGKKEERIHQLRSHLRQAKEQSLRYDIADSLYREYSAYKNDSAVAWALRCYRLAMHVDDSTQRVKAVLHLVDQYTKSGYFTEAAGYFSKLHPECMSASLRCRYYDVGADLYGNFGYSTEDPVMKNHYWQRSIDMRDSGYKVMPPRSFIYYNNKVQQLVNSNHGREALRVSDEWLKMVHPGTHDYAIMAYYRSEAYRRMGNGKRQKEWLARSAVADLDNAVMDHASLWMLAGIIYREGDINRAYRYMAYSWKCISFFSTHKRAWDVTPILTVINNSYQQKTRLANNRLMALVVITIILLSVSVALLIYVQRKRKQLWTARNALDKTNQQLRATNEQLKRVNVDLEESDRVKDKYIGNFFSLYSSNIEKLDSFRAKVRRKLKAGQRDELMVMTDPDRMHEEAHKEMMENFDTIFLSLYPTFIDDFNALLKPECKIRPVGKSRMNTTLRIFALIRLGITESARIAGILGYSPTSIYNYRTRAKNMSAVPREEFEERIRRPRLPNE